MSKHFCIVVQLRIATPNGNAKLEVDHRKVEVTTNIKAAPETIISAFTDRAMLRDWWGVEQTLIEKRLGGLYTLAWIISVNGLGFVSSGIIKEYKHESVLVVNNLAT